MRGLLRRLTPCGLPLSPQLAAIAILNPPIIDPPERLFLRKRFVARHLLIDPREDQPVVFEYGGDQNTRVELRKPTEDDPGRGYTTHDVLCSVSFAYPVPEEHREDFVNLARGKPPKG